MARIDMAEVRAALGYYNRRDLAEAIADVDRTALLDAMYPVDGPHDHDHTTDAAYALSSLVRYLNLATRTVTGTPHLHTLDRVVAHIEAAAGGLRQTTRQTAERLDQLARTPGLASDGMAYEDMTAPEIAARAAALLRGVGDTLGRLHTALSEATSLIARLYIRDSEED